MASIQRSTEKGYRIYWCLYFPDGTNREKYKASRTKPKLQEILPDVMKIETLSKRGELSNQDLVRAINLKIIDREEAALLSPHGEDPGDHHLEELRPDFETKSKAESAGLHSHTVNLSRADLLERHFKEIPIRLITQEEIERFRAMRRRTVTATTVNHDLKILRKFLDIAVNKRWINENVARKVKLLSEPKNRIPRCLYPDEIGKFFEALKEYEWLLRGEIGFIVRFLMHTGLRRSELCNLKPENIKLHLRQIQLIGKGRKARVVGIHRSLMEEIGERVKQGHVLAYPIDPSSISHAFKRVCRAAGLSETITLHSLRHTYISYLLEKGIQISKVRDRAGHFDLSITDRYTHGLPSNEVSEDVLDFETGKL